MTTPHAIAAALLRSVAFAANELATTLAPTPPTCSCAAANAACQAHAARVEEPVPGLADVLRRIEAIEGHVVNGTLARAALTELLLGALTPATLDAERSGTDVSTWGTSPSVAVVRRALKTLGGVVLDRDHVAG